MNVKFKTVLIEINHTIKLVSRRRLVAIQDGKLTYIGEILILSLSKEGQRRGKVCEFC